MSSEFNIIDDIYELIRQTQLKENHYKRIDDVKSRRRFDAVITAKIEMKATISKSMSIITISISINEKAVQTSAKTTIWNFNQFRTSILQIIKTSNLDSTKEKFMKADKCFNCNESDHFNRDCSKFKKFKIVQMNVEDDAKKSKKE